ncbi:MAG TPA: ABC transporter permease [bacterium]|nr:ABC transporter permease [bacterium]
MRRRLINLLARTWRNIAADAGSNLVTVLAVGLAVSIPLLFALAAQNMGRLVDVFMGQVEVVVYLSEDVTPAQQQQVLASVQSMAEVESARIVDAEEALRRFREELPDMAELVRELADNPLPPSIEIRLHARYRDMPATEALARKLAGLAGVIEIDTGRQWAQKLGRIIRYLWIGTFVIGLFLAAAAGLLVANTIRLAIYRRREEIALYRLVGASNAFIRLPLLIEGIFQGAAGSLVALALCYGAFAFTRWRYFGAGKLEDWLLGGLDPTWFSLPAAVIVLALGGAIGWLAALLSTGRYMRV